jgi:hypothetical protein
MSLSLVVWFLNIISSFLSIIYPFLSMFQFLQIIARDLVREREKGNSERGVLFCIAARARIVGEGFHIGGNLAVCENLITLFQLNYRIATVFNFSSFTYDIHSPDVKCLNQKSFL